MLNLLTLSTIFICVSALPQGNPDPSADPQNPSDPPATPAKVRASQHGKIVLCHIASWANYRTGKGKFTPDDVDPELCTHVVYNGARLNKDKWEVEATDPWMDQADNYGLDYYGKTVALKKKSPGLKVILTVGGWRDGSKKYSDMAKDPEKRAKFVKSVVKHLKRHKFDGMNLMWLHPGRRGGDPTVDKENFSLLLKELKESFSKDGSGLSLKVTIGQTQEVLNNVDVPEVYQHSDHVAVTTYDYNGLWTGKIYPNAPLDSRPGYAGNPGDPFLNVRATLDTLQKKGAVAEKTIMGLPLYGRTYQAKDPAAASIGSPAEPTSFTGPFTREDGLLGFNEICRFVFRPSNCTYSRDSSPAKGLICWPQLSALQYDEFSVTPFVSEPSGRWVTYDDEESLGHKVDTALGRGLAGVSAWSVDTDDFRGDCGNGKFPLLRAVNRALNEEQSDKIVEEEEEENVD